ncbi:hypothetical protein BJ741DRAFT_706014 [Chytriomyces cf. hyalinus JEL632]|nr:hypothetical protein BJ741DRAFT_706014 [Chytriomyces cf. hyalinus JEL632]
MRPRVSMSEVHSYSHALQQQQQTNTDEAASGLSPAERHVLDKATASYPRRIPSPLESPILPSNMPRQIGSSNNMPSPEDGPTYWNQPNCHHSHHPSQQQQQPNQTIPRHTLTHSRPVNIITPRYSPYSGHRRSVDVNDRLASFEQRLNCSVAIVASSPPYSNVGQTHLERRSMPQIGSSSPLENTRMRGYSNPQPVHSHQQQYPQPVRTVSIPSSAISQYHPSVVHHPIQSIPSAQSVQPYPQHNNNTHNYASSQRIQHQQPQYVQPSFVYATTPQNHSIRPQQHQPYDSHHQQQQQQRPPIILPASLHYPQQQPCVLVQSEPVYIASSQEGFPVYSNPSQQQPLESGRTFQCDQCDLSFTRKHDMNRHIRSVHAVQAGEALFACGICGQGFGRVDSLKRHVNICKSAK